MVNFLPTGTSRDVGERKAAIAVLPIGSLEQHGSILPLTTDTIVACAISEALASAHGLRLLPPITFGCSHEHSAFAGTVSITATTLAAVIEDIRRSLRQQGVEKLVLVNGHGGNYVLGNVVQEANVGARRMALFPHRDDWARARKASGMATGASEDMHGGEFEVSILRHVRPDLVGEIGPADDHVADERTHLHVLGMKGYTQSGLIGRPSLGTAEKGALALKELARAFSGHLAALRL